MDQLRGILPTLVTYLSSQEFVVYTYAAVTLERILLLKREDGPVHKDGSSAFITGFIGQFVYFD